MQEFNEKEKKGRSVLATNIWGDLCKLIDMPKHCKSFKIIAESPRHPVVIETTCSLKRGTGETFTKRYALVEHERCIAAFEFMLKNNKIKYHCDPWQESPGAENYDSVKDLRGQFNYKGKVFTVSHLRGRPGMGGMDQGAPNSVDVVMSMDTTPDGQRNDHEVNTKDI